MSFAVEARVRHLEAEVKRLNEVITGLIDVLTEKAETNKNGPRQMCPKCNEVPNYHLHVRSCKGPKATAGAKL